MKNENLCQSCGMDMVEYKETYGTNADGSLSEAYCQHCFANGKFIEEISMSDMIGHWIPHLVESKSISEEDARKQMDAIIPNLKRWKIT